MAWNFKMFIEARRRLPVTALAAALACAACAACAAEETSEEDLTSASAKERRISWSSFVYVAPGSGDDVIRAAIQKQVKSAIGAFRKPEIAIQDRDALSNLDPAKWIKDELEVVGADQKVTGKILRVRYNYSDVALIRLKNTAVEQPIALLFGDYVAKAAAIKPKCSDDQGSAPDSLWFHYTPQMPSCAAAIAAETAAINSASKGIDPARQLSSADANRDFVNIRAKLLAVAAPPPKFPEYDRLWGFGTTRTLLVAYAFFGVDEDIANPDDVSAVEHFRFLRTLIARYPTLAVTKTDPGIMLLDFDIAGKKYVATYKEVCDWIVDGTGFPAAASTPALRLTLRQQAVAHWGERWIYWELPVTVKVGASSRPMTLQLRSYWGYEDGKPEWRQAARWRYLEAFWHGDVFMYQGHSHFGHGPLEPTGYTSSNFPNRYQVMLINSCVSFNYYDVDFVKMHPGGTANLDIVVNGLPAYWTKMGEATANLLIGLTDGAGKSWQQVLAGMTVKSSWAPGGHDPMRAVNGELDNVFSPTKTPIQVQPR